MTHNDKQARERQEPEELNNPVPLPLLIFFLGVIAWGAVYYFRDITSAQGAPTATGDRRSSIVVDPNAAVDGAAVFAGNCAACHQAGGQGLPGVFPPLLGSEWVVAANAQIPIQILLHGISGPLTVAGAQYAGVMPAFGQLSDAELAAVISHLRSSWGNAAAPVSAADIAKARSDLERSGPWSEAELREQVGAPD